MSFVQRRIDVSVKLATNSQTNQPTTFDESGTDTVKLSGARTLVRIQNSGAPAGGSAQVDIFGMTPSLMNQLATLGLVFNLVPRNTLTILAGDDEMGMTPVFSGTIVAGYGDYNSAPDVPFHFECNAGVADSTANAPPSSFPQATSVADIMSGFARQMGLSFENNNINITLPPSYFSGNVLTQMRACADHANINAEVIGTTLAIWAKGGTRSGGPIPLVSPDTGMIGYPAYTQQGIIVKTLFNPQISFGGLIKVQSSLKPVNDVGQWGVYKLDLALDAMAPRGQWMMTCYCYNPKYPKPIPPQS